ncbi:hypothetical protein 65p245 [Aeromonas phage 65]|uniref:Uncharacterized protein n=2 Tax=Ishigurovirus osborne TaxID=260149 RepID=A0A219YC94_9CAUD|nr:hypothetical protein ST65p245 [Aeromonas phage 65]ADQ53253.1 hypothetical protein 65p245 [Aeromonas phage 65]APU01628.1 hypothetical protein [Aeromonas phage 65.2]
MLNKRYKIIESCAPALVKHFPLMVVGNTFTVTKISHLTDGSGTYSGMTAGMTEITMGCGTIYNIDIQLEFWCFYTENMITCRLLEINAPSMKVRFKSPKHREEYISDYLPNQWVSDLMGDRFHEATQYPSGLIALNNLFVVGNRIVFFKREHKYLEIVE